MRTHGLICCFALGAIALFSACSDSASDAGPVEPVEAESGPAVWLNTTVEPGVVGAGDAVACTCHAYDAEDRPVSATAYTLNLSSTDGVTINGMQLTPTVVGELEVACALDGLLDPSPAKITVVPGGPATSAATVDPNPTSAGETATVSCHVVDIWGNEVNEDLSPVVTVSPDDSVVIDGYEISTEVAGEYDVRCEVDGGAQANPAPWTVEPGEPVTFSLVLSPSQQAYALDQTIKLTGEGEDAFGNLVVGIPVTDVSVDPDGHNEALGDNGDTLKFDLEGFYEVTAASTLDPSATDSRLLVVDETGPTFSIGSPGRGITRDEDTQVVFSGSVTESLGTVAWLKVNGEDVDVPAEGGSFEVVVPLVYGMNFLWAHAADSHGVERIVARSVLWSPSWYALDDPSYETDGVDEGMVVSFNQDGVDDVADLMATVVAAMDFASALPPTEFECLLGEPCKLYISSAKVQPQEGGGPAAEMELDLIDGGIAVEMDLYNFKLITALDIPNPVGSFIPIPGVPETLTADVGLTWEHIRLNMNVYISMVDGETVVNAEPLETQLDMGPPPTIEVIDGVSELDSVIDGVLAITVPLVHAAVEVAIPFVAGELMQGMVGGLTESFVVDEQFEIKGLVDTAPPNILNFQTQAQQLQCTEEQMRLSFEGLAHTSEPLPPYEVPGSPMYAGCGPAGALPPSEIHPLMGGLHDDFLNQLLFAMWEGGSLSYDLEGEEAAAVDTGDIGITLSALKVDPMLPLMLNSCHGSDILQVGDLFVDAELELLGETTHLSMWMQLQAELAFSTTEGEDGSHKIAFDVIDFDPFLIEVIENEGLFEGDDIGLADLLSDTFLPMLLDGIAGDALAFEIPVIELGEMSEDIDVGTGIKIDIEEMNRSGAYLTFGGELQALSGEAGAP